MGRIVRSRERGEREDAMQFVQHKGKRTTGSQAAHVQRTGRVNLLCRVALVFSAVNSNISCSPEDDGASETTDPTAVDPQQSSDVDPSGSPPTNGEDVAPGSIAPDSNAQCAITPCGGDVVGTWSLGSLCGFGALEQLPVAGCTGTSDTTDLQVSGTVTYDATGAYSSVLTLHGPIHFAFPDSCIGDGSSASCEQLTQSIAPLTQGEESVYESFTCSGGDTCECVGQLRSTTLSDTGTYVVSESGLMMTDNSGETVSAKYCVTGSTLVVQDASAEGSGVSYVLSR